MSEVKTAFLFPGQGGQCVGMGKDLYDEYEAAKKIFETAERISGLPVSLICFEGPEEKLKETLYSQLSVLTVSIAALEVFKSRVPDISFSYAAGLSLGEYAALYAAGVFSLEDVFSLVKHRAAFMQKACMEKAGAMVSVLGLEESSVEEVCREAGGFCSIANLNCPGQIVVSCDKSLVEKVIGLAKEKGAKRSIEIQVAGAFHSEYMRSASDKFQKILNGLSFEEDKAENVVFNLTAQPFRKGQDDLKKMCTDHIVRPVLWEKSIRYMASSGISRFIEIGPGKVLGGLLKRIDKTLDYSNIEDVSSLEKTVEKMNNE